MGATIRVWPVSTADRTNVCFEVSLDSTTSTSKLLDIEFNGSETVIFTVSFSVVKTCLKP